MGSYFVVRLLFFGVYAALFNVFSRSAVLFFIWDCLYEIVMQYFWGVCGAYIYSLVTGFSYILWIVTAPYMFLFVFRSTDVSLVNNKYVHFCISKNKDQFLY